MLELRTVRWTNAGRPQIRIVVYINGVNIIRSEKQLYQVMMPGVVGRPLRLVVATCRPISSRAKECSIVVFARLLRLTTTSLECPSGADRSSFSTTASTSPRTPSHRRRNTSSGVCPWAVYFARRTPSISAFASSKVVWMSQRAPSRTLNSTRRGKRAFFPCFEAHKKPTRGLNSSKSRQPNAAHHI
jgi:hypothetical protein